MKQNMRLFDPNKLVGRFQNALTFFIINGFGRDFFQSCVYFHGGHDGTDFRSISEAQCVLKHYWHPIDLGTFFFYEIFREPPSASQLEIWSHMYPFGTLFSRLSSAKNARTMSRPWRKTVRGSIHFSSKNK